MSRILLKSFSVFMAMVLLFTQTQSLSARASEAPIASIDESVLTLDESALNEAMQELDELDELSIMTTDEDFVMDKITHKTVSDIIIHNESDSLDAPIRRRGIQFKGLTPLQIQQLEYFIQNHTAGVVN